MYVSGLKNTDRKTQVVNEVLRYIRTMDLERDNKLPREEAFCKIIGTSRVTLRAALDELASNGMIFRRHGKGTFVNVHSLDIRVSFNPVMDFYDMIAFSGYHPGMEVLERYRCEAPDFLRGPLGLAGGEVYVMKKVFYADRKFCAYTEDYLNTAYLDRPERMDMLPADVPIFPVLDREFGIKIEWDKVEIATAQYRDIPDRARPAEDGILDKPLLLLHGVNYDVNDRPIFYGKEYINDKLIQFNQIRKRRTTISGGE